MSYKNRELIIYVKKGKVKIKVIDTKKNRELLSNEYTIPLDIVSDGYINDLHHFYYLLNKNIKTNEISYSGIRVILESSKIIARAHSVPNISNTEIEEMLKYEIEDIFPVDPEEYEFSYETINIREKEQDLAIILTPKDLVQCYKKLALMLKKDYSGISTKTGILLKELRELDREVAFLEFNYSYYTLNVFTKKEVFYYKTEYFKEVVDYLNSKEIDIVTLEKLLCEKYVYLESDDINEIKLILSNFLFNTVKDIENILNRFNLKNLFLYGDLGQGDLKELIVNKFSDDYNINEYEIKDKATNSIIPEKKTNPSHFKLIKQMVALVVIAITIMINYYLIEAKNDNLVNLKNQLSLAQDMKRSYNKKLEALENNQEQRTYSEENILNTNLQEKKEDNKFIIKILEFFEKCCSDNFFITQYQFKNSKLEIFGISKDLRHIEEVIKNYNNHFDKDMKLVDKMIEEDYLTFELNIFLNGDD